MKSTINSNVNEEIHFNVKTFSCHEFSANISSNDENCSMKISSSHAFDIFHVTQPIALMKMFYLRECTVCLSAEFGVLQFIFYLAVLCFEPKYIELNNIYDNNFIRKSNEETVKFT